MSLFSRTNDSVNGVTLGYRIMLRIKPKNANWNVGCRETLNRLSKKVDLSENRAIKGPEIEVRGRQIRPGSPKQIRAFQTHPLTRLRVIAHLQIEKIAVSSTTL
jgi:hypothetical protein